GSARAGDGVSRTAERREVGLGGAHLRPKDELAMTEHARDPVVDSVPEPPALRGEIDERDGCGIEAGRPIHYRHKLASAGPAQPVRRRGPGRRCIAAGIALLSRQRIAISRLATPCSPVTG